MRTARLFEWSPELPVATRVSGVSRHNAGGNKARKLPVESDRTTHETLPCEPLAVRVTASPGWKWLPQMAPEVEATPGCGPVGSEGQNKMVARPAGGWVVGRIGVGQPTAGRGASVNGGGQGQHPILAGAAPMTGEQGRQAAIGRWVGMQLKGGSAVPGASPDRGTVVAGRCVSGTPDDSGCATDGVSDSFAAVGREPPDPGALRQALSVTSRNTGARMRIGFPEIIPPHITWRRPSSYGVERLVTVRNKAVRDAEEPVWLLRVTWT